MRLDKFLKVSRIIKRRTIAKMVVDEKKAKLDGKIAKAGTEVKVGQELELEYFNKYFKFKILRVPLGNVQKEKTSELVELIESKGIEKNFSLDTEEEFLKTYRLRANAKINIGLNILRKKENGYHELDMTMLPISYYDMLTLRVFSESGNLRIFCRNKSIPTDKKNILFKVYEKFYEKTKIKPLKIKISLKKRIPPEAGLGGGSSDGAFF